MCACRVSAALKQRNVWSAAHQIAVVVALTACADDPFPDLLLEAGARGFLTKDSGWMNW
jgi:DNA-binding NarL/FixJ family response regulator